ncbi:MAG: YdcF family protein [Calditrichaceae bacterium]|nr:YdcF family protein [Calditrichaceae bacterium]MBN2707845.1 YdcF family protein [Calditrichaceae bacterium]
MTDKIAAAIVILGSPNTDDGQLYDVAVQRCILALDVYRNNRSYKFLLTGGYGAHFNNSNKPHAHYLAQYLIRSGVPKEDILEYAESANSIEDAVLSQPIIEKYHINKIIVITSDYHFERANYIFEQVYKDSGIDISFKTVQSDSSNSELNIADLIEHEQKALKKLKKYGLENYYKK